MKKSQVIKFRAVVMLALATALSGTLVACGTKSPELPSQAQQPSQSGDSKAEILTPEEGTEVPQKQQITGTTSGVSSDQELWIFVRKGKILAPQSSVIQVRSDGGWSQTAYVGNGDGSDAGDKFEITVQIVPKTASQSITDYLQEAAKTGKYPGFGIPQGSVEAAKITVTKAIG